MNAITHPEVEAINPVSVIPAQPAQHMLLVPLSCLRPSRRNVRKTAGPSIEALAASSSCSCAHAVRADGLPRTCGAAKASN